MRLIGIATKPEPRGPMLCRTSSNITRENGLLDDCRGSGGQLKSRQITIISFNQWFAALKELGDDADLVLPWFARRANLNIENAIFGPTCLGWKLQIGPDALLEVTDETKPCERMDEVRPGLKNALAREWRGGITCRVVKNGAICLGDNLEWRAP